LGGRLQEVFESFNEGLGLPRPKGTKIQTLDPLLKRPNLKLMNRSGKKIELPATLYKGS
jgi:hypothetical protein